MSRRIAPNHPTRRTRYVLLLTPDELILAKQVAAREFRPLPDFFRRHIYERAARLGLAMPLEERGPKQHPAADESRGGQLADQT